MTKAELLEFIKDCQDDIDLAFYLEKEVGSGSYSEVKLDHVAIHKSLNRIEFNLTLIKTEDTTQLNNHNN